MGGNRIGKHLQQSKQPLLAHPTDVIPMAENILATEGYKVESILNKLGHGGSLDRKSNHVQRTKSSIKKRIIVRRTVPSMFGEQTGSPVKNGLYGFCGRSTMFTY